MARSLGEMLRASAAAAPQRAAVIFRGETTTYAALEVMSNTVAAFLRGQGIQKGNRVGLYCINSPAFVAAYFGIVKAGAVVVPINLLLGPEEVAFILGDAGARGLVFYESFAPLVKAIAPLLPALATRVVVGKTDEVLATPLAEIMAKPALAYALPEIDPDVDLAAIPYTSGTTGKPKGAMLSHGNLLANASACHQALRSRSDDVFLTVLPMFHSFACTAGVILPIFAGATISAMVRFMPDEVGATIEQTKATVYLGVPSMFAVLANLPEGGAPDLSSLRMAVSGGAALPVEIMRRFEQRYRVPIHEGDGPTECGPVTTFNPTDGIRKPGTIGPPLPTVEMRVVDGEGKDLPVGEIGEIVVRGPSVMKGYWKNPEATKEAFFGDWFRTGDLGSVDADGYFSIVDRKKDMIIVNGMNVYPRQVEEVIYRHPAVAEVAVVGEPDQLHGEVPRAVIVLKEGATATEKDILALCREHLGRFQVPRIVEFAAQLPKNATGKILKREIARARGERERGVSGGRA